MFKAQIKEVTFDRENRTVISLLTNTNDPILQLLDDLHGTDVSVEIKKWREKRSLDANGYLWSLIGELSAKLGEGKTQIYRHYIREVGEYEVVCVQDKAVKYLIDGWESKGLGWLTDTAESKLQGCTNVLLFIGSSAYDTKQMSRLIDSVVQDCKEQGIETLTPAELERLKNEWK